MATDQRQSELSQETYRCVTYLCESKESGVLCTTIYLEVAMLMNTDSWILRVSVLMRFIKKWKYIASFEVAEMPFGAKMAEAELNAI